MANRGHRKRRDRPRRRRAAKTRTARTARLGERIRVINRFLPEDRRVVWDQPVEKSCGEQTQGKWYCASCELIFENNIERDAHSNEPGEHIFTWCCFHHGPEVP